MPKIFEYFGFVSFCIAQELKPNYNYEQIIY